MKKLVAILLAVILLGCSGAYAEGLLPQFDDAFGIEVPSMANSLGREPDSDSVNEAGGQVQTFESVTEEDYQAFSNYLIRNGCAVANYSLDGSVLHVILKKDEIEFTLDYDIENQQAVITYPSGVRVESFNPYRVGAIVTIGRYEQDGDNNNGPEPIEWIVVSNENGRAVLLSMHILEAVDAYDEEDASWETWSLRTWLNSDFYNTAFTEDEKALIILNEVDNTSPNPISGESGGNDTRDYVYLLSVSDVYKYFGVDYDSLDNEYWEHNSDLAAWPTQYVINRYHPYVFVWESRDYSKHEDAGAEFRPYEGAMRWFLRSRFYEPRYFEGYKITQITNVGTFKDGYLGQPTETGVRPVICVSIE